VQVTVLAGAAAAMGSQSAAVNALGIPGISSTYMTGMLTGMLADLAAPAAPAGPDVASRLRLIAMLIAGAIASGITYAQAPRLAPLIPLASLACVIGIAASARTRTARTGTAGARGDPPGSDQEPADHTMGCAVRCVAGRRTILPRIASAIKNADDGRYWGNLAVSWSCPPRSPGPGGW
jgi:Protein of unknown function (DUF1275)